MTAIEENTAIFDLAVQLTVEIGEGLQVDIELDVSDPVTGANLFSGGSDWTLDTTLDRPDLSLEISGFSTIVGIYSGPVVLRPAFVWPRVAVVTIVSSSSVQILKRSRSGFLVLGFHQREETVVTCLNGDGLELVAVRISPYG